MNRYDHYYIVNIWIDMILMWLRVQGLEYDLAFNISITLLICSTGICADILMF